MVVGIVNYGLGNIKSLENIIKNLDYDVKIISSPKNLTGIDKLILPGVGTYSKAMQLIRNNNWEESINDFVSKKKFLLGICLGMQILSSSSEEVEFTRGLDLIKGKVISLKQLKCNEKIPHVGWNGIKKNKDNLLLKEISENTDFYFVHSYVFKPDSTVNVVAETKYGVNFCSIVNYQNIFGTQFHPEKSSASGRKLLKNFLDA